MDFGYFNPLEEEISKNDPIQIIELGSIYMHLKYMKDDVFLIRIFEDLEYISECRSLNLTSFNPEFRGAANGSLQNLNIIESVNSNPQALKARK